MTFFSPPGGGGGEWQEDGNGNIVPIDGEPASVPDLKYSGSKPFTITVRSSGGDASTISGALALIPALGIDNGKLPTVEIDLEAGATYSIGTIQLAYPWVSELQFVGDATTPPTINVQDGTSGLQAFHTNITLTDLNIGTDTGTAGDHLRAQSKSQVDLNNVSISGAANDHVDLLYQSELDADANCSITGTGSGTSEQGIIAHSSSHIRWDGSISACGTGVKLDRGATGDLIDTDIDNCGTGVLAEDGAKAKLVDGPNTTAAVTNCTTGVQASLGEAFINIGPGVDTTGTTTVVDPLQGGLIRDQNGNLIVGEGRQFETFGLDGQRFGEQKLVDSVQTSSLPVTVNLTDATDIAGYIIDIRGQLSSGGGELRAVLNSTSGGTSYSETTKDRATYTTADSTGNWPIVGDPPTDLGFDLTYRLCVPRARPQITRLAGTARRAANSAAVLDEGSFGDAVSPSTLEFTTATVGNLEVDVIALGV